MNRDPISLETAERMLPFVRDVDERATWVKMAFILKEEFGEGAFDAWDQWSQQATSYKERDARTVWRSVKPGAGTTRATVGTLVTLAKAGGWRADDRDAKPSADEMAQRAADRGRRIAAECAESERETAEAARQAADMWERATPANGHAYLARKGVAGAAAAASSRELDGILLVPVKHGPKELVGLQRIDVEGGKKFLHGTPKKGGYTPLGKPAPGAPVVIVEGYATGLTVHQATGFCVVVAFDAGNLEPVAKKIRAAMPDAALVIGADDDALTKGNPGITAATAAARAVGGRVVKPTWVDAERGKGTDFNDLQQDEGLEAVRQCFGEPEDLKPAGLVPTAGGAVATQEARGMLDYVSWLPDHNDKGRPLATIENLNEVARRLGITVRYNVISKEEEILIPNQGFSVDNRQNASFAWLTSECAKFHMPTEKIGDFITYLADRNQYNPVANWIASKPWDGVDRLSQLIDTVRAVDEKAQPSVSELKRTLITRWMVSAVAAALRPNGVSAHGVLVFQGDQYVGKTKWFKTLVPAELGVLQDGVILRPEDRDSVKQCCANWLVELGELDATFRKSDIAALKAFLTKDRDVLRRAYARKESEFARRTVFFASVNPTEFLHDHTGNRRYWTIACEYLDHSHTIDMQQCWAQVATLFVAGETWFLTPEEMDSLNGHNKAFEVVDPIEELIATGLRWEDDDHFEWRWMAASDVLRELGRDTPTLGESTRAAHVIRERNGKNSRKSCGVRQLLVPPTANRWKRP